MTVNGLFFGGCDVGSMTTKAVIMDDHRILAGAIAPTTVKPQIIAEAVINRALAAYHHDRLGNRLVLQRQHQLRQPARHRADDRNIEAHDTRERGPQNQHPEGRRQNTGERPRPQHQ